MGLRVNPGRWPRAAFGGRPRHIVDGCDTTAVRLLSIGPQLRPTARGAPGFRVWHGVCNITGKNHEDTTIAQPNTTFVSVKDCDWCDMEWRNAMNTLSNTTFHGLVLSLVCLGAGCLVEGELPADEQYILLDEGALVDPHGAALPSDCREDSDCGDGFCGWESDGKRTCKPWAGLGDSCGGRVLPAYRQSCDPSLTCIQSERGGDMPGTCQQACRIDADCQDGYCGETEFGASICYSFYERDEEANADGSHVGEPVDSQDGCNLCFYGENGQLYCSKRMCPVAEKPVDDAAQGECTTAADDSLLYRSHDAAVCAQDEYVCPEGSKYFINECGCGCTLPGRGESCPAGLCAQGFSCISYYGVAGPAGELFSSCEIPCDSKGMCPRDEMCMTISDGAGEVCVPGPAS